MVKLANGVLYFNELIQFESREKVENHNDVNTMKIIISVLVLAGLPCVSGHGVLLIPKSGKCYKKPSLLLVPNSGKPSEKPSEKPS